MSVIDGQLLPAEVVASVIRLIESHGLDIWVYYSCDWFVRDPHGPHVEREQRTVQFSPTVVRDFDDLPGDVVKIVGVSDDPDAVARCEADARDEVGDRVSASRSQPYYLDVTHPQANKGNVVKRLSEMLNVPIEQIATIGDSANDVLMFAHSGLSIAMGNAGPDVQRTARRVTASNEQEGFARAVECYILSEQGLSVMGRNMFQRPKADALRLLGLTMDISAGKPHTEMRQRQNESCTGQAAEFCRDCGSRPGNDPG